MFNYYVRDNSNRIDHATFATNEKKIGIHLSKQILYANIVTRRDLANGNHRLDTAARGAIWAQS
jgi:hypothetical protein